MSHISDIYCNEIYGNLHPLYGNWEPSQPILLGDFGTLQGRIFVRLGSLRGLGINFGVRSDSKKDQKYFASSGNTEVKFNAAGAAPVGGAVNLKANVEVDFSSERAVFFNAADCEYSMIEDKVTLGNEIMDRYRKGTWQRGWTVVTDLIKAGSTTVAVSGASTASIVLEATGNVPNINLADASIGLSTKFAKNVGYQVVAADGLIPLFGLSRIRPRFLWFDDNFRPLSMAFANRALLETLENSAEVQTEGSEKELIFAQVD